MVGLHGMECAHDTVMAFDGLLDLAEEQGYIIVTPLGYRWNSWYGSVDPGRSGRLAEKDVMNVLKVARNEFNVDEDRSYLFGTPWAARWRGRSHSRCFGGWTVTRRSLC